MTINISTDMDKTGQIIKYGQATGIAIDSTGIKTFAISFTSASGYVSSGTNFQNSLTAVYLTLADPSATDAVIGTPYVTGESSSGFTINAPVTTASATAGATVKVNWQAFGY